MSDSSKTDGNFYNNVIRVYRVVGRVQKDDSTYEKRLL